MIELISLIEEQADELLNCLLSAIQYMLYTSLMCDGFLRQKPLH